MDIGEWESICEFVVNEMAKHVPKFTTPISLSHEHGRGEGWGTGNYFKFCDHPFLLTNQHVLQHEKGSTLAHLPGPTDDYVALNGTRKTWALPLDIGIERLTVTPCGPNRELLTTSVLDQNFCPQEGEILFWFGYQGTLAKRHDVITDAKVRYNWFDGPLVMPGLPMASQQDSGLHVDVAMFDSAKHVMVHYPSSAKRAPGAIEEDLPNPKGMSGSLLWDTKYLSCHSLGEPWDATKARVCGVLWAAHDDPEVVVATKIEHIRTVLRQHLNAEYSFVDL